VTNITCDLLLLFTHGTLLRSCTRLSVCLSVCHMIQTRTSILLTPIDDMSLYAWHITEVTPSNHL